MSGTAGQAAYEAGGGAIHSYERIQRYAWEDLPLTVREGYEAAAQAALAAREPQPAPELAEQLAATKLVLQETSRESSQRGTDLGTAWRLRDEAREQLAKARAATGEMAQENIRLAAEKRALRDGIAALAADLDHGTAVDDTAAAGCSDHAARQLLEERASTSRGYATALRKLLEGQ